MTVKELHDELSNLINEGHGNIMGHSEMFILDRWRTP